MVHLRGRHQRGDVAKRLHDAGLSVTSHVLYDQVEVPPDAAFTTALGRTPLCVPLFFTEKRGAFRNGRERSVGASAR